MSKRRRPSIDLTKHKGNLSSEIQTKYREIMALDDENELINFITSIAQPFVGHGLSEKNFRVFIMRAQNARERYGLNGIKKYLTDYMLKGSGLGVIEDAEIDAIASMITEDPDYRMEFSKEQAELKKMTEEHGYMVKLLLQ